MNELGKYNGISIQYHAADDTFVNATQMCQATGRLWADYWRLGQTQQYIEALSSNMGIPIKQLVVSRRGNQFASGGTWVHRRVAIHLAQELGPILSLGVSIVPEACSPLRLPALRW